MMTEDQTIQLSLSRDEVVLVRTALGFLVSTLGREEADELAAVQAILARLEDATR